MDDSKFMLIIRNTKFDLVKLINDIIHSQPKFPSISQDNVRKINCSRSSNCCGMIDHNLTVICQTNTVNNLENSYRNKFILRIERILIRDKFKTIKHETCNI